MYEQHDQTPEILKRNHYVYFDDDWPDGSGKRNTWWRVERQYRVKYDVARNIASGDTQDLSFSAASSGIDNLNLALLPVSRDTLYEVLVGWKTRDILVYPYFRNDFVHELEATNVTPDVTDQEQRYIGFWEPEDSPWDEPRIREHVISDQEPPQLRLYNDGALADRIVFRFIVNHCNLMQLQSAPDQRGQEMARRPLYLTERRRR